MERGASATSGPEDESEADDLGLELWLDTSSIPTGSIFQREGVAGVGDLGEVVEGVDVLGLPAAVDGLSVDELLERFGDAGLSEATFSATVAATTSGCVTSGSFASGFVLAGFAAAGVVGSGRVATDGGAIVGVFFGGVGGGVAVVGAPTTTTDSKITGSTARVSVVGITATGGEPATGLVGGGETGGTTGGITGGTTGGTTRGVKGVDVGTGGRTAGGGGGGAGGCGGGEAVALAGGGGGGGVRTPCFPPVVVPTSSPTGDGIRKTWRHLGQRAESPAFSSGTLSF